MKLFAHKISEITHYFHYNQSRGKLLGSGKRHWPILLFSKREELNENGGRNSRKVHFAREKGDWSSILHGHNWVLLRLVDQLYALLSPSRRSMRRKKEICLSARALRWIRGCVHGRTSRLAEGVAERGTEAGKGALTLPTLRPGVGLPPTSSSSVPPRVCHHRYRPSVRPCVLASTVRRSRHRFLTSPAFLPKVRISVWELNET